MVKPEGRPVNVGYEEPSMPNDVDVLTRLYDRFNARDIAT
jgi:hypothetical protein